MAKAKAKRTSASKTRKTARSAARAAAGRKKRPGAASRKKRASRKAAGRKTTVGRKAAAGRKRAAVRKAAPGRRRTVTKEARRRTSAPRTVKRKTSAKRTSVKRTAPTRKTTARPAPRTLQAASTPRRAPRARVEAGHGRPPALERERRRLPESDLIPSPPSSLDLDRTASAARSGQAEIAEALAEHTETGPEITGGDVDASWGSAYTTGDEAPGGDNPTPDQDVVDDIGRSLGLVYEDSEELKGADKISERDKHRWELDPASSEDYRER